MITSPPFVKEPYSIATLVYYDSPRLFVLWNSEEVWVGLFVDETETTETYLYSNISEWMGSDSLDEFPLREAIVGSNQPARTIVTAWDGTEESPSYELGEIKSKQILERWLPKPSAICDIGFINEWHTN